MTMDICGCPYCPSFKTVIHVPPPTFGIGVWACLLFLDKISRSTNRFDCLEMIKIEELLSGEVKINKTWLNITKLGHLLVVNHKDRQFSFGFMQTYHTVATTFQSLASYWVLKTKQFLCDCLLSATIGDLYSPPCKCLHKSIYIYISVYIVARVLGL